MAHVTIKDMLGITFTKVYQVGDGELRFESADGSGFRFYHYQDCCESVYIESIVGDLSDLIGAPIMKADEEGREAGCDEVSESGTWTFYKFATRNGYVDVRWLGESNGYYSESVSIDRIEAAVTEAVEAD